MANSWPGLLFKIAVIAAGALSLPAATTTGSRVCGQCHAEIYRTYSATAMARTSGAALPGELKDIFDQPAFTGAKSAYTYSVTHNAQAWFLDFRNTKGPETGRRQMPWFVGSGTTARSFLIAVNGFLYESPATWYARTAAWNFSPGYQQYSYPFLTRAIAPGCLECHATGIQAVPGTQNGYLSPPFREPGIGCERCHGPGGDHAAGMKSRIINPARLEPERRDSVCAQCHLSADIRVDRASRQQNHFAPGDKLSDFTVAFARAGAGSRMKVTSHVENLAQSACKRASGDRLWCGTCHDPHSTPAPAQKAAWFRSKCLTCHAGIDHAGRTECTSCHMPRNPVTDADHVVYTDHSIPRRPGTRAALPEAAAGLVPFGAATATPRDLGLAYAIIAVRERNTTYSNRAFDLLRTAERTTPDDPQVLSYLADLYKTKGDDRAAALLYQRLMRADPAQAAAPSALGAYQMEAGHYPEAIRLWETALRINPALVLVRANLAVAYLKSGDPERARQVLEKALEFNPALLAARNLLATIPTQNAKP